MGRPKKGAVKGAVKDAVVTATVSAAEKHTTQRAIEIYRFNAVGIDVICDRIRNRETITDITDSMGLPNGSLTRWLNDDPERMALANEARRETARQWDELALQTIKDAGDAFELQKAREIATHLRWRSGKIAPREYGDKMAIGGADDLPAIRQDVTMTPDEAYRRLIEGRK